MKKRVNFLWFPIVGLVFISIMVIEGKTSFASETGNYPGKWYGWFDPDYAQSIPPYGGYREEWENQTVIDAWGYKTGKSFDEIKHLFPGKAFYEVVLKNPEVWGNFRINETAYLPYDDKIWLEAKEKYKWTAHVDDKSHLRNYIAGLPFPGTKDPREMAWNVVRRHLMNDNFFGPNVSQVIRDRKGSSRWITVENHVFRFLGRLYMDPKPSYKPNPKNFDFMQTFGYMSPYDLIGTVPLIYRYDDPDKQDDMWIYLPALRRTRRMSTTQRWDRTPGGADVWWDSFQMFYGKPSNYEWNYLGQKELLCGHNAKTQAQMLKEGHLCGVDNYWQRINCEILEAIPQITSPVSRFEMYLDPNTYLPLWSVYYDKKGREWVIYCYCMGADGKWFRTPANMIMIDVQRTHSSSTCPGDFRSDVDFIKPSWFEMHNLRGHFGGR